MQSVLATFYPGSKMHLICKTCKGSSGQTMERFRCPLCKKNFADYKKAGLEHEAREMLYLWATYCKIKAYNQATTGIKKLDCLLELLFGHPKTTNWRDYKKRPIKETSPYVVLRTVNLGRTECPPQMIV